MLPEPTGVAWSCLVPLLSSDSSLIEVFDCTLRRFEARDRRDAQTSKKKIRKGRRRKSEEHGDITDVTSKHKNSILMYAAQAGASLILCLHYELLSHRTNVGDIDAVRLLLGIARCRDIVLRMNRRKLTGEDFGYDSCFLAFLCTRLPSLYSRRHCCCTRARRNCGHALRLSSRLPLKVSRFPLYPQLSYASPTRRGSVEMRLLGTLCDRLSAANVP